MKELLLEKARNSIEEIRKDFPILHREVHGRPLVYFDNGATTQKPRCVIHALVDYYENYNANIHRGVHYLSQVATDKYEEVREKIAKLIGAKDTKSIIYTKNTTEASNLFVHGWGNKFLKPGDEVLLSKMEHHSNIVPWHLLAQSKGITIKFFDVDKQGSLILDDIDNLLTDKTRVVAVSHMSNVLGTINPVKEIIEKAHKVGAVVFLDGAQSVPHMPIDVEELDCDFLAFSAHKMLGPTGVGILYGKKELLEAMDPYMGGGDMIQEVWLEKSTWNELPWKFEAGTPNIADVIAFGAALDYLNNIGMDFIHKYEQELTQYAIDRLQEIDDIKIYGPLDATKKGGLISFNLGDIHPNDVGTLLDQRGIAIRTGHHCCQPLMKHYQLSGTCRASFYVYNTREEVDYFIEALHKVKKVFERAAARKK